LSKAAGTCYLWPLYDLTGLFLFEDDPPPEFKRDTSAVRDWWFPGNPWIKLPNFVWKFKDGERALELTLWQLLQVQLQTLVSIMLLLA